MPRREQKTASEQASKSEGEDLRPLNGEEMDMASPELVKLGCGSRSTLVEAEHEPKMVLGLRGLLPVPPEVEAEIGKQEAKHPMTPEYRKTLRDRLTLEHYFSNVEVAFRRTDAGIEVLAVGPDEIAKFRATSTWEVRQGVVYGVG
jgi:hypothetical protein